MAGPLKFGQAASDYTPSENSDEVWIRTFKDPATQIRICPAVRENDKGVTVYGAEAWVMEREHYAEGIGSFPCAARFGVSCVGCDDANEDVSQRRRQYYINALDEKGDLRVYKFGVKLYKIFLGRQQRFLSNDPDNKQALSDRDYVIIRSGKGRDDTIYDPEPADKYEVEFPSPLHDISQIITDRYEAALIAYTGSGSEEAKPAKPAKTAEPKTRHIGSVKAEDVGEWTAWGESPSDKEIDNAETADIKLWLDSRKVEYPARAARVRLVEIAKKASEPPF